MPLQVRSLRVTFDDDTWDFVQSAAASQQDWALLWGVISQLAPLHRVEISAWAGLRGELPFVPAVYPPTLAVLRAVT